MGLWNISDPKLKELGLVTDQAEVAKAMFDNAARAALTQLRRIPHGTTIEEDHQRNRQLIAHYIKDKTGAIEYSTAPARLRAGDDYARCAKGSQLLAERCDQGGR